MTDKEYAFHLEFEDGSNPYYHYPTDRKLHNAALHGWEQSYELQLDDRTESPYVVTEWYTVKDKAVKS